MDIVSRSVNMIRKGGMDEFVSNLKSYPVDQTKLLYESLLLTVAIDDIIKSSGARSSNIRDVEELVDFAFGFRYLGFSHKPIQRRSEIVELLGILKRHRVHTMMEIGTDRGGTLFLFSRVSAPGAKIVSVNLPWSSLNAYCMKYRNRLYASFATNGQSISLLSANSHERGTIANVKRELAGKKLDFLFIDGDHSYEGVKKDFEMYSPLVRKGGIVAFHDIATIPGKTNKVRQYWKELKQKYRSREIVHDDKYGIGLIYV